MKNYDELQTSSKNILRFVTLAYLDLTHYFQGVSSALLGKETDF
jgi:hypothetical protein